MSRTPRKTRQEMAVEQRIADLGAVAGTPAGRRLLWEVIYERCRLDGRVPTGPDGVRQEGRRDVGLELKAAIQEAHPQIWALMKRESADEELEELTQRQAAKTVAPPESDE